MDELDALDLAVANEKRVAREMHFLDMLVRVRAKLSKARGAVSRLKSESIEIMRELEEIAAEKEKAE